MNRKGGLASSESAADTPALTASWSVVMEDAYIVALNIQRYRRMLLAGELSEASREIAKKLLANAEAELKALRPRPRLEPPEVVPAVQFSR